MRKQIIKNHKILKTNQEILSLAKQTLCNEGESVLKLQDFLTEDFANSVHLIFKAKGRLVVTGIGKSAIIANKIVATLNSTGTPALFMHAADAIHGDLGMVQANDVVLCISQSGNTPEIKVLIPLLKHNQNKLIGMTGNSDSYLAQNADFVLLTSIQKEACPMNLAPTTSSTAQMAMGDALAVCLLDYRGFTAGDFAKYHPGGSLGKKLYLKVADLVSNNAKPKIDLEAPIKDVIVSITSNRLGATAVLKNKKLLGIITDGDIRRMLEKNTDIKQIKAKDIMNQNPKSIDSKSMAVEALQIMRENNITQIIALRDGNFEGFVHIHDLMREGII